MALDIIAAFGLVTFLGLIGSILSIRLGQSPIVGMLLVGALSGPLIIGLGDTTKKEMIIEEIKPFAEIGAVLLLFTIGVELNLKKVLGYGLRALIIGVFKLMFITFLTYQIGLAAGLNDMDSMLMAIIMSITSTTIFAGLVKKHMKERETEINLMMAVLILEDLFGILVLTIISSYSHANSPGAINIDILLPIAEAMVILAISYLVIEKIMGIVSDWMASYSNEVLMITALALCALLSTFTKVIGLEASIGAFLAGTIISSNERFRNAEKDLLPFISIFSLFFFVAIGMEMNLLDLQSMAMLIILFSLVSIVLKLFSVSAATYLLGFNSNSAAFSAMSMLSVGEFSLLIAKTASSTFGGMISINLVEITSVIVLVSSVATSAGMANCSSYCTLMGRALPNPLKKTLIRTSIYLNQIVQAFEPGGIFYNTFDSVKNSLFFNSAVVVTINAGIFLMTRLLSVNLLLAESIGMNKQLMGIDMPVLLQIFGIILSAPFVLAILKGIKKMLDSLTISFLVAERWEEQLDMTMFRHIIRFSILILLAFAVPFIVSLMGLPKIFNSASAVPLFIAGLYLWRIGNTIHKIFEAKSEL